ncbi:MAG: uridine kinase [Anaerolineaceae bacterium]
MKHISPGVEELEYYEFVYALNNLVPKEGWNSIVIDQMNQVNKMVESRSFYESIRTKEKKDGKIILDPQIVHLTQMLFVGLVSEAYPEDWVVQHFFFDIRGFLFFHRTRYFTNEVIKHFEGKPFKQFEAKQKNMEVFQGIGYTDFKAANAEIDQAFIELVLKVVVLKGTPILLTLAGPTAAGKTEIMERLFTAFEQQGQKITTVEMDNFLIDREARGEKPLGIETSHFELFKQFLNDILMRKESSIPRYDFIKATSSHDLDHHLRPGGKPLTIAPADIVFIEGNFPFQIEEINRLIGIKVVYLTDDPVRLKRKWKRDIDYRKKYDVNFFMNRYFKTQFLRADDCYLLQLPVCDIVVDTTHASLWVSPDLIKTLGKDKDNSL